MTFAPCHPTMDAQWMKAMGGPFSPCREAFLAPTIPREPSPAPQPLPPGAPGTPPLTLRSVLHRVQLRDPGRADDHRKQFILELHLNALRETRNLKLEALTRAGLGSFPATHPGSMISSLLHHSLGGGVSGLAGTGDKIWGLRVVSTLSA